MESKPITVITTEAVGYERVTEEWSYDRILETFPDDSDSLVNPLVRRCQEYEAAIEQLQDAGKVLELAHDLRTDQLNEARVEIERLRARLAGVPHFADEVIAYPGMTGWHPTEDSLGVVGETGLSCGNDDWGAKTYECYSTLDACKAAEAAGEEGDAAAH